ncbi:MAG: 4Fe-4S ferredoxin N-terminal domain-containing protein [Halodesulfurarchaeum sp.]|nr:4Fe-4S ferredoxin N-terminal domain-containing protein [Halodesulfurarchaeum sp.]
MAEHESRPTDSSPLSVIAEPAAEYDRELGKAMGEAAKQLRTGELTEAEFYERFHDRVVEEFGFDERPVAGPEE